MEQTGSKQSAFIKNIKLNASIITYIGFQRDQWKVISPNVLRVSDFTY